MKAEVLEFSSMTTVGMAICPPQHHSNQEYIRSTFANIDQALIASDTTFYERARAQMEQFYDPTQLAVARRELSGHGDIFMFDNFVPYKTVQELQDANCLMQSYILAMPVVRELYNRQAIDGYSETYRDNRGVGHEDLWQFWEMRDGMVKATEEEMSYVQVFQDVPEDAPRMTVEEQCQMADMEDLITHYLKNHRVDITNKFGGEVGG